MLLRDASVILLEFLYVMYIYLFVFVIIFLWCHIDFSSFWWTRHCMSWSSPVLCIYNIFVIYKYEWMTISVIIIFLQWELSLLICCYSSSKIDDIKKITYCDYILVVSTSAFHTLIFRSLDPWNALQRVHSVVHLHRLNNYSRYRGFF